MDIQPTEKAFKQVNLSAETHARLQKLAALDRRSMAATVAWLLDQEYARRYSTPQPLITIEQAQAAVEAQS